MVLREGKNRDVFRARGDRHGFCQCFGLTITPYSLAMADVTKGIRGYVTDTREYAANTRFDIRAHSGIREYTRVRGAISKIIKVHTNIHKYADWIFADTRTYADIRTGSP